MTKNYKLALFREYTDIINGKCVVLRQEDPMFITYQVSDEQIREAKRAGIEMDEFIVEKICKTMQEKVKELPNG